ncbi:MAG: tyrosine-type recombinase/integrase [Verrucomicrobiota bacterium]
MSEQKRTSRNNKRGTERGQQNSAESSERLRKHPKTHQDYWKERLRKRTYKREGIIHEVSDWQIRMKYAGREAWFNLKTANKAAASVKARDIYLAIVAEGWDAALDRFKDTPQKKEHEPTIGEFIEEVTKVSSLRPGTLHEYTKKLRLIAGEICGIPKTAKRFDPYNGGRERWLERVDGLKLNRITPKKVQQWKLQYLKEREGNPAEERSARVTVNSSIRCAKSLFSERLLKFIDLKLPDPLPFEGVEFERVGRATRYRSEIDPAALTKDAFEELRESAPEQFKIFLLAITVGLRRAEIDTLVWRQIDDANAVIRIETHEYAQLKTASSEEEVDVDPRVLSILKEFERDKTSEFVIESPVPFRKGTNYRFYRCQREFQHLIKWLRRKGVKDRKPIHALRKEFGSLICEQAGIYAASNQLRHSSILLTRDYYVDKKAKTTVQLEEMLGRKSENEDSKDNS